jgi:long-chain acyl-CoA synthetase
MDAPCTINERFRQVVSAHADQVALIEGIRQLTYRDLDSLSNSHAVLLRARLNLAPGQILLAWLNNCTEFIASYLAAMKCGAAFFPLNTNWRAAELNWVLNRRLPVAGLVTKKVLHAPWDVFSSCFSPREMIACDDPDEISLLQPSPGTMPVHCPPLSADRPAVYFTSSGSTGVPKLVARSHRNTVAGAADTASALGIEAGLRFLSVVPFYHANGFDNSLSLPLLSGATAVLQPQFTVPRFHEALAEYGIQVLVGSPGVFELVVRSEANPASFQTVQICASSGGPIAKDVIEAIRQRYAINIRQVYGSSETGVIAVDPPEGGPPLIPVPDALVEIFNSEGRPLPAGAEGEIAVKGPMIVSGYVGDPESTARIFTGGYYRTGDLGVLDAAGRLTLLGRLRPMINLSGTKVDPVEVEKAILNLDGVNTCRVLAEAGPQHNQILKAVIAVRTGKSLSRADVIEHCRRLLAEYKIPRIITIVPALPEDGTGKPAISWELPRA